MEKEKIYLEDDGTNFKEFSNQNWRVKNDYKDVFLMLFMLLVPSLVINLTYIILKDCLISQIFFQICLFSITFLYNKYVKELLTDIIYIKSLSKIPRQKAVGIFLGLFFFVLIGIAFPLIIKFARPETTFQFKIPSGLIQGSKLQKWVHFFYFFTWIFSFGLIQPIVELRHYLIIVDSKFNENFFVQVLVYVSMCSNYLMIVVSALILDYVYALVILGLILAWNLFLIILKNKFGFLTALLTNVGVYLGLIFFVMICLYLFQERELKVYTDYNTFDMTLDIFVDEVDIK